MRLKVKKKETEEITSNKEVKFFDLFTDGLTQGAIEKFLQCPRKFQLAIVEGKYNKYVNTEYMDYGTIGHNILDKFYTGFREAADKETYAKNSSDIMMELSGKSYIRSRRKLEKDMIFDTSSLEKDHGMIEATLKHYPDAWKSDFNEAWIALEEEFCIEVEIRPNVIFRIRGKRDGLKRVAKKLFLLETKFKGRVEEDFYEDYLSLDLQTNLYLWSVWKDYNEFPGGVVYNIVRRPQQRRGAKESLGEFLKRVEQDVLDRPEHYFIRFNGISTPTEIKAWEKEFIDTLNEIYDRYLENKFRKNPTACKANFGTCPFIKVCASDNEDAILVRDYVYPELSYGERK